VLGELSRPLVSFADRSLVRFLGGVEIAQQAAAQAGAGSPATAGWDLLDGRGLGNGFRDDFDLLVAVGAGDVEGAEDERLAGHEGGGAVE
jgi:hypothetical protein